MNERERMLRRLSTYDFAVQELHIYLDTHPNDTAAANALNYYEDKGNTARREFEDKFGPLTPMTETGNRWAWIADPWPWDQQEG